MMAGIFKTPWLPWLSAWRLALSLGMMLALAAQAQTLRDPTVTPSVPGVALQGGRTESKPSIPKNFDLIFGPGDRWRILHDGRLLSVGDKIGEAQIARISETQVWLQIEGTTQKIFRHPDVMIRPEEESQATSFEQLRQTVRPKKNETLK